MAPFHIIYTIYLGFVVCFLYIYEIRNEAFVRYTTIFYNLESIEARLINLNELLNGIPYRHNIRND